MDVAGVDIVLAPQQRRAALQPPQRGTTLAVACVDTGDAQYMHGSAAGHQAPRPGAQLALGIDPAQGPGGAGAQRMGLRDPGTVPVAIDTAGGAVHQLRRLPRAAGQRLQQVACAQIARGQRGRRSRSGLRRWRQMHHALGQVGQPPARVPIARIQLRRQLKPRRGQGRLRAGGQVGVAQPLLQQPAARHRRDAGQVVLDRLVPGLVLGGQVAGQQVAHRLARRRRPELEGELPRLVDLAQHGHGHDLAAHGQQVARLARQHPLEQRQRGLQPAQVGQRPRLAQQRRIAAHTAAQQLVVDARRALLLVQQRELAGDIEQGDRPLGVDQRGEDLRRLLVGADELAGPAQRGDRRRVDLLLGEERQQIAPRGRPVGPGEGRQPRLAPRQRLVRPALGQLLDQLVGALVVAGVAQRRIVEEGQLGQLRPAPGGVGQEAGDPRRAPGTEQQRDRRADDLRMAAELVDRAGRRAFGGVVVLGPHEQLEPAHPEAGVGRLLPDQRAGHLGRAAEVLLAQQRAGQQVAQRQRVRLHLQPRPRVACRVGVLAAGHRVLGEEAHRRQRRRRQVQRQRPLEQLGRLVQLLGLGQQPRGAQQQIGVGRLRAQGLLTDGDRLGRPASAQQQVHQHGDRGQERRADIEHLAQVGDRLRRLPPIDRQARQLEPGIGVARLEGDRRAQQAVGLGQTPGLPQQRAQQPQRISVARLGAQQRAQRRLSQLQFTQAEVHPGVDAHRLRVLGQGAQALAGVQRRLRGGAQAEQRARQADLRAGVAAVSLQAGAVEVARGQPLVPRSEGVAQL